MGALRIAGSMVMALMVGACAGEQIAQPAETPLARGMNGRWMLSAPNAPPCGMEFDGGPGQQQGLVRPEGGCPGNFYMSRRWTLAQDTLTIADNDNAPLAQLKLAGDRFAGQSTAGLPVTLSR
jgi:hypothetical protein